MGSEWYYTQQGKASAAPVPPAQLKQLAATGQLLPTDLVWQDGMPNWTPAGSIKGLFPGKPSGAELPPAGPPAAARKPPANLLDLHPLAVFLLTLGTAGVFGVVYASKVCNQFSAANQPTKDKTDRPLGRIRHPFAGLALSYLTCGFYFAYWLYRMIRECQAYLGRDDLKPHVELSLMLIFPPYAVYVAVCRLPDLIRQTRERAGVGEAPGLRHAEPFLNPLLYPALPFLGMIYQDALNQAWVSAP